MSVMPAMGAGRSVSHINVIKLITRDDREERETVRITGNKPARMWDSLLVYKPVSYPSLSSGVFLRNSPGCYSHPVVMDGNERRRGLCASLTFLTLM